MIEIDGQYKLFHGNNKDVLKTLPDNSIDSVVTDPPYELGFMGKKWDATGIAYDIELWAEILRVLKPGGHLLAFSGSRTYHRMVVAIEDAGFEIRDQIMWIYGSGFPKSHNISKAIDKLAGAEREVIGTKKQAPKFNLNDKGGTNTGFNRRLDEGAPAEFELTAPATDEAKQWDGWGTALKPAHEPIVVARKPVEGSVAENVLEHGTGGLNIDASRVATNDAFGGGAKGTSGFAAGYENDGWVQGSSLGRWPANVIHDGSDEVVELFPDSNGAGGSVPNVKVTGYGDGIGNGKTIYTPNDRKGFNSGSGSAARFFYCAKANKRDRNEGCENLPDKEWRDEGAAIPERENRPFQPSKNNHPTVKPTDLMRYLCRLVTPPNGIVLDPFMGSGSTGKAAILENFRFIGIELEGEYLEIAKARIEFVNQNKEQTLFD